MAIEHITRYNLIAYCIYLAFIIDLSYYYFSPMKDIGYYDTTILIYILVHCIHLTSKIMLKFTAKTIFNSNDDEGNFITVTNKKLRYAHTLSLAGIYGLGAAFIFTLKKSPLYHDLTIYHTLYVFSIITIILLCVVFSVIFFFFLFIGITAYRDGKLTPYRVRLRSIKKYTQDTIFENLVNIAYKFDCPSCFICLEDFNNESQIKILKCGHYFDKDCIELWLTTNKSCPCCRTNFDEERQAINV